MIGSRPSKDTVLSFLRFCANCVLALCFKLGITWILIRYMNGMLAYFFAHIGTFFVSYLMHARYSFRARYGLASLFAYMRAVIYFKIIDYSIFSIAFAYLEIDAVWSILLATLFLLIIRFGITRKTLQTTGIE